MDISLTGRRGLVCGSTQGIGRACARVLAELGCSITLMARNEQALEAVARELPRSAGQSHDFISADFSDPAAVTRAITDKVAISPPFHILINNTGGPPGGRAIDAEPQAYEAAFRAHVIANQILARAVVPGMIEAKYGRIINIISTSVKAPIANLGVSNTIRGAVAQWAKTLANELGPHGITVNNVLPGYTDTERLRALMQSRAKAAGVSESQIAEEWRKTIPAGRFGRPEEIAAAVAFLASPAAGYVNGINLPVDGGRTPGL